LQQWHILKNKQLGVNMQHIEEVRNILSDVLSLGERRNSLNEDSPLLGAIPELDSMAVVNVITALEEHFDITVDDDEISAKTFETVGSLAQFVEQKLAE
jgi:acyl carrier protein